MSEKKKISSGAKKAEALTRKGGRPRKKADTEQTASVQELSNNTTKTADKKARGNGEKLALKHERKMKAKQLKAQRRSERLEAKKQAVAAKIEARAAKRKAAAARAQARREHALKQHAERRAHSMEKRRTPGFGGWLAAVISLGASCLVLATIVTYGWINMTGMQAEMIGGQRQSLYELNAIVDNLDSNLSKARVATSAADRTRVLSDIAIQSEMAEMIVERLPLDQTMTINLTTFLNKMGDSAQAMLYSAAEGGEPEEWHISSIEYMYENNLKLKKALNELVYSAGGKDIFMLLRSQNGLLGDGFGDIENNVIEEPKGIFDGPFAESAEDTNHSYFDGLEEVDCSAAEEIARTLFAGYSITDVTCTGEANARGVQFYNLAVHTDDGEMLAQLSKKGGKLVMFDSYKECSEHNFSTQNCITIAQQFLSGAGYENLEPVWVSESGTTCNINFCPVQDGAIIYPDMIKVKVCEERGMVTGAKATAYVMNHSQRDISGATITRDQAQSAIDGRIEVSSSRLALIPLNGEEVLCYEFNGTYGGSEYYVYVDAHTGVEVEVMTVIGTARGRSVI